MTTILPADRVRALLGTPAVTVAEYVPRRQKSYTPTTGRPAGLPKGGKQGKLLTWLRENKRGIGTTFTPYDIPETIAKDWRSASVTLAYLYRQGILDKIQESNGHGIRTIYTLRTK